MGPPLVSRGKHVLALQKVSKNKRGKGGIDALSASKAEGFRELAQHSVLPSLAERDWPGRCELF